ncbi:MAG: hypothetical protein K0U98_09795 [Deltaproteobacteria bacterium]|nr:hypothetical protein [Deltaproteobacteria bacterium]
MKALEISTAALTLLLCTGFSGAFSVQAQSPPSRIGSAESALTLHAYKLEHQPASEALALVTPLLSRRGTVELQAQDNTLVIRDSSASIYRIVPVLSRFDHPRSSLAVEVLIIRATAEKFSPPSSSKVPRKLLERLQDLLPYHTYEVLAGTRLNTREGEQVSYQLGARFSVRFRIGTLIEEQRVKLHGFQVFRGHPPRTGSPGPLGASSLIATNLFLHLDQPLSLALASSKSSKEALMVVVTTSTRNTHSQDLPRPNSATTPSKPRLAQPPN